MWSFSEGKHQENYHYVRVPAITNEVCDSEYGNAGVIKDSMICAGYPGEGGKDTCSGKSKHRPLHRGAKCHFSVQEILSAGIT